MANPDIFLFNVLTRGFSTNALPSISLYANMWRNTHLRPDNFTYSFAIMATSRFPDGKYGMLLHAQSNVDGKGEIGFSDCVNCASCRSRDTGVESWDGDSVFSLDCHSATKFISKITECYYCKGCQQIPSF